MLPPTPESPQKKLRDEYYDECLNKESINTMEDQVAFWLSRTVSKEVLQDIMKEIKGRKKEMDCITKSKPGKHYECDCSEKENYNQALSDVAALVVRKLES